MFATLLAIGLDPERCVIFHQDHVRRPLSFPFVPSLTLQQNQDHVELAWLLACFTSFGKLRRMTTWKVISRVSCLSHSVADVRTE